MIEGISIYEILTLTTILFFIGVYGFITRRNLISILISVATVSVFISEMHDKEIRKSAQRGASSSYSIEVDGYQITAVGEVPAETVETIASSMRQR